MKQIIIVDHPEFKSEENKSFLNKLDDSARFLASKTSQTPHK